MSLEMYVTCRARVSVQLLRKIDRADIPRISRRIRSVIQSTPPGSQYF